MKTIHLKTFSSYLNGYLLHIASLSVTLSLRSWDCKVTYFFHSVFHKFNLNWSLMKAESHNTGPDPASPFKSFFLYCDVNSL